MNYKEQLRVAKEHNLSILDLEIGYEVECVFEEATKPYDFEEVCSMVDYVYLSTEDLSVCKLTKTILKLNEEGKDWKNMSKWDIAEEAVWVE